MCRRVQADGLNAGGRETLDIAAADMLARISPRVRPTRVMLIERNRELNRVELGNSDAPSIAYRRPDTGSSGIAAHAVANRRVQKTLTLTMR